MDDLLKLAHALSPYTICGEGNVSQKVEDEFQTCFYIKASGTSLDSLKRENLVACHLSGSPLDSTQKPSMKYHFMHGFLIIFVT